MLTITEFRAILKIFCSIFFLSYNVETSIPISSWPNNRMPQKVTKALTDWTRIETSQHVSSMSRLIFQLWIIFISQQLIPILSQVSISISNGIDCRSLSSLIKLRIDFLISLPNSTVVSVEIDFLNRSEVFAILDEFNRCSVSQQIEPVQCNNIKLCTS